MIITQFFNWLKKKLAPKAEVVTTNPADNSTVVTTNSTPAEIAEADLETAITIVNNVKTALASPAAVLLTAMIPGTVDDTIREDLIQYLPVIAAALSNVQVAIKTADASAVFNEVLSQIRLSPNLEMDAFEHALASKLLTKITKGSVPWTLAVMSVEYFLKNLFGAKKQTAPDAAPAATVS